MRTGKKAVVFMKIEALVEVDEDEYYAMIEQADTKLHKHVVEGIGFLPFRSEATIVQEGTTVNELTKSLTIQPGTGWQDR